MTKRHIFQGIASINTEHKSKTSLKMNNPIFQNIFTKIVKTYPAFSSFCKTIPVWLARNSLAIMLILVVFIFSLLLPDIAQKLHKHSELKAIKNVLDEMQNEVKRAEVACLAANEEICTLHCILSEEGIKRVP